MRHLPLEKLSPLQLRDLGVRNENENNFPKFPLVTMATENDGIARPDAGWSRPHFPRPIHHKPLKILKRENPSVGGVKRSDFSQPARAAHSKIALETHYNKRWLIATGSAPPVLVSQSAHLSPPEGHCP